MRVPRITIMLGIVALVGFVALLLAAGYLMPYGPDHYWSDAQVIALANAITAADSERIRKLVADGVDVNARGKDDVTPLIWCVGENNKAAFEQLLTAGADSSRPYRWYGSIFFFLASSRRDADWLSTCLRHGADPNLVRQGDKRTPIYGAIGSRRKENLDVLIEAGADLNYQDASGATPLVYAASLNWFDSVYYLLQAGANYKLKTNPGNMIDGKSSGSRDLAYHLIDTTVSPQHALAGWREKVVDWLDERGFSFEEAEKRVAESDPNAFARWQREQEARKARRGG